jgi:hypothetical protein
VSTDAAVADPGEVEIELGYFNLERTGRQNVVSTPNMVVNYYGLAKRLELVGEFRLQVSPDVEIADPAVSLKGVLNEGSCRRNPGSASRWRRALCFPRPFRTSAVSDSRRSGS